MSNIASDDCLSTFDGPRRDSMDGWLYTDERRTVIVSEVVISGYKNTSSHGVQINCIVRPTLPVPPRKAGAKKSALPKYNTRILTVTPGVVQKTHLEQYILSLVSSSDGTYN